jgi:hypothetical protein
MWKDAADMTFDHYVWKSPRDLDAERAEALLTSWHEAGGDPSRSPFQSSTDIGWFHRELVDATPGLDISTDAVRSVSKTPIWMSGTDEAPARLVALRLTPAVPRDVIEDIFSLAVKYDLVLFDQRTGQLRLPLDEMGAYADATFWPGGAIQAAVAGIAGAVIAVGVWLIGIPIVSGVVAVIGGFMFVMAVYTFIHAGRTAMRTRQPRD